MPDCTLDIETVKETIVRKVLTVNGLEPFDNFQYELCNAGGGCWYHALHFTRDFGPATHQGVVCFKISLSDVTGSMASSETPPGGVRYVRGGEHFNELDDLIKWLKKRVNG